MSKRDEQRRQADRDFEEIRQAIANLSDAELCETLRDVPHRKWLEIEKDTHMAVGIVAHRAADLLEEKDARIAELERHATVQYHDALHRRIAELENALRWYAVTLGNSRSMDMRIIHQDGGQKARDALGL